MKTCTFKTILYGVAARLKLNPYSDDGLTDPQAQEIAGFVNEVARVQWEGYWWPELIITEQRDVEEDSDEVRYVPWAASGKTTIEGSIRRISTRNPLVSDSPNEWSFVINQDGAVLGSTSPDEVWVQFRQKWIDFTGLPWDRTVAYAIGDVTYYQSTGECYVAILAGTNKNPSTETTYWTKVDFPAWLRKPTILAAYAAALLDQENYVKSDKMEERAEDALSDAVDIEQAQQQQVETAQVRVEPNLYP